MLIYIAANAALASWTLFILWRIRKYEARGIGLFPNTKLNPSINWRYLELFESSKDAIFFVEVLKSGKFRFESLNPAAKQQIDPDGFGLEGRCFEELDKLTFNPACKRILLSLSEFLTQIIATGMPVQHEGPFSIALEANSSIYEFNLVPMADGGRVSHVLCFARDITVHKNYENELFLRAKLEERLSCFIDCVQGLFYSYRHGPDGNNTMPFASGGISELFGLQPEDVEQSIAPLKLLIHPDDVEGVFDPIEQTASDLFCISMEFRAQHPSRGEIWVKSRAMPITGPDGSFIWHGFMHDITERKKMDELMRRNRQSLAEAQRIGQMGSWELAISSGEMMWSDEIYRILEIPPGDSGTSRAAFLNVVHPDDRDMAMCAHSQSLEENIPFRIDYRLLFPDGRVKHVRESCEMLHTGESMVKHVHGTVQDITALKVIELQLHDTQDKLRELIISRELHREDERKRIAWEMHEELGQLLFAAKMRVGGMRTQIARQVPQLTDDGRAISTLIEQSIRMVHNIVSDLRPTVLLHGVVAALEWLVAESNKHPGMECELKIVDEESTYVSDELSTLVFRLAQEVIENAIRHDGVSNIVVSWISSREGNCLAVEHNGLDNSVDQGNDNTLKFFSMRERISAFGGEMQVFSTLQHGMVIKASFPNR
jgi:PAS domain S-box-containing protein